MKIPRFTRGPKILVNMGNRILDEVQASTPIGTPTVRSDRSLYGTLLQAAAGGVASVVNTPFQIFKKPHLVSGVWDGSYDISLYPGTIGLTVPTNIFTVVNQSVASTYYVILSGTSDGYSITDCEWSLTNTAPVAVPATADTPPTTFSVVLGLLGYTPPVGTGAGTVNVFQIVYTNLAASPAEWTRIARSDAGPYELAYQIFYYWLIQ
jgi:hypothetical protein